MKAFKSRQRGSSAQAVLSVVVAIVCVVATSDRSDAQFRTLTARHATITTDLPPSIDLSDLPATVDAAVDAWQELLRLPPGFVDSWRVDAYIMTDRGRFERAGHLDPNTYDFREGHQVGDLIYINEQPSAYYRRHLLIHELWHWFIEKSTGGYGSKWFMEGTAEWTSTHRGTGDAFEGRVVPASREASPYWGRFEIIRRDGRQNQAPGLNTIFFGIHDIDIDSLYAWSWLTTLFFAEHPRYRDLFQEQLLARKDNSDAISQAFRQRIASEMPIVEAELELFAEQLDYGVAPAAALCDLSAEIPPAAAVTAAAGWQMVASPTESQRSLTVIPAGMVTLQQSPYALESTPNGITLRYIDGHPLGSLLYRVVDLSDMPTDASRSPLWPPTRLPTETTITLPPASALLMRVNDANAELSDNQGQFELRWQ